MLPGGGMYFCFLFPYWMVATILKLYILEKLLLSFHSRMQLTDIFLSKVGFTLIGSYVEGYHLKTLWM